MRLALALIAGAISTVPIACGGDTDSDASSGGGAGVGAGAAGGVGGSGALGGSSGSGGAGGAAGSAGCGPVVPTAACAELAEVECLAAHPRCAPVYDDACCPSCSQGPCADCTNFEFHECVVFEESNCVPGTIAHCGTTPSWACSAGTPTCAQGACNQQPGCVAATPECGPDEFCPSECHPVRPESCGPACVTGGPSCPDGVAEVENGAYTGFCIPQTVCKAAPPCPTEPQPGLACPVLGQFCQYGPSCGGTFCTCQGDGWDCTTTPC